ncbi:hypothetical protein BJ944DRAFT_262652 [Cunninghamella echinulata]|nr:hypothetical protein BJ944DRAFT_262652 [Cunninghamella echinulata]
MVETLQNIVDTHIHFWQRENIYVPWLKGTKFDTDKSIEEYKEKVKPIGVKKGVYVEVDVDSRYGLVEGSWIHDYVQHYQQQVNDQETKGFGGIGAVVAYAPVDQGKHVRPYLNLLQQLVGKDLLRGIRFILQDSKRDPNRVITTEFIDGVNIVGEEYHLIFELVIDCHQCPQQFPPLIKLVSLCTKVTFVLDHMGKPPCYSKPGEKEFNEWENYIKELASYPNVLCKVSGLITELEDIDITADQLRPFIQVARHYFGINRLMFGGDWPICELKSTWMQWVQVLNEIIKDWSLEDRNKLFVLNAEKCYKL